MSAQPQHHFTVRLFDPDAAPAESAPPPLSREAITGAPPLLTGGDVIRQYLDDLDARLAAGEITEAHRDNHRRSLRVAPKYDGTARYVGFMEIVGDLPVADLIQNNITVWLNANPKWVSTETKRNNTAAVIACFNWADDEGLIKTCPYKRNRRIKWERVTRRNATDEEADRIWAAASPSLRKILWIVDRLGIRTCEARELRWNQIRWKQSVVVLKPHENKGGKLRKGKPEPRIIGIDEAALCELRKWYENRRHETFVFLTVRGHPWTKDNLCRRLQWLREHLGMADDLTPYCFRHRFATDSRLSGVCGQDVTDQLGHSSRKITEDVYEHLSEEQIVAEKASHFARIAEDAAAKRSRKKQDETPLFDLSSE